MGRPRQAGAEALCKKWVEFCKERGLGLRLQPDVLLPPQVRPADAGSPRTRRRGDFWIDHGKACIRISQYLAEELGQPCVMNIWTGDGFKDIPADRMGPRMRYKESIDEILSEPYDFNMVKPCVEIEGVRHRRGEPTPSAARSSP